MEIRRYWSGSANPCKLIFSFHYVTQVSLNTVRICALGRSCLYYMYRTNSRPTNLINWAVFLHIFIQPKLYQLALRPVTERILPTVRFDQETKCDISDFRRGKVEVIDFLGPSAV
jgi:hypothetical protein